MSMEIESVLNAGPAAAEDLTDEQIANLTYAIRHYDPSAAAPESRPTGPDQPQTWRVLRRRLAEIEAWADYRRAQRADQPEQPRRSRRQCVGCGAPATMMSSLGPTCPNCYDDYSG